MSTQQSAENALLSLHLDESGALERQLNLGVARAEQELRRAHCPHTEIALAGVIFRPLSTVTAEDLADDGEVIAGAALRFGGEFSGSALFSMPPESALDVARAGRDASDPIGSYVAFGECVASEVVSAMAAGLGADVAVGPATLVEESVTAFLFGTHAPPDTMVVVTRFDTSCEPDGVPLPGHLVLLFDPKTLEAILSSGA